MLIMVFWLAMVILFDEKCFDGRLIPIRDIHFSFFNEDMMKMLRLLPALLGILLVIPAMAQDREQEQMDKTKAAQKARQQVNGRVLKVDRKKDNYRVKMLKKSGRVVSVDVDSRSGQVSSKEKKKNGR
jgi:competence protein ComGC